MSADSKTSALNSQAAMAAKPASPTKPPAPAGAQPAESTKPPTRLVSQSTPASSTPASSLAVTPASARKQLQQTALASVPAAVSNQASQMKVLEDHFDRVVKRWVNAKNTTDPMAKEPSVTIPLAALSGSTAPAVWKAQYEAAGYVVKLDAKSMTVALP